MANVVEFTIKGVDKASPAFKSTASSIGKVAKSAAKVGAIAAVAFAAAAVATLSFTKRVADLQDKVAKLSLRLGVSVKDLSAFHFAAELGGITTDKMNLALERLARGVSEAAEGTGEAKDALEALHINSQKMVKLPLAEQMNIVADALQKVEGQSDKVRIAYDIFGRSGVGMITVMKEGSQSFRTAAKDLAFLGAVITKQGAANAEEFNDSLTRVGRSFRGLSMGIGNELIPMITGLSNKFADFVASGRVGIVGFVKNAIRSFITFGIVVSQVFNSISGFFSDLFSLDTMSDTLNGVVNGFKDMFNSVIDVTLAVAPHLASILSASFKAAWSAFASMARSAWSIVKSIFTGGDIAETFGSIIKDAMLAATAELGGVGDAFNAIKDIVIDSAESGGRALLDLFGINTTLAAQQAEALIESLSIFGKVTEDTVSTTVEKVTTLMDFLGERLDLFRDQQKSFAEDFATLLFDTMMNTTKAVGDAFSQMIVDGKSGMALFKQIAKDALKQVIASFITMKIQRFITAKSAIGATGANTMATMSMAPFPINLSAPTVAARHMAQAAAMAATAAHGGLGFVAQEQTVFLARGERVVSPRQNRDLTDFLGNQGGGGSSIVIENLSIQVTTSAESFADIDEAELEDFVAGPLFKVIDALDDKGVRQKALERSNV